MSRPKPSSPKGLVTCRHTPYRDHGDLKMSCRLSAVVRHAPHPCWSFQGGRPVSSSIRRRIGPRGGVLTLIEGGGDYEAAASTTGGTGEEALKLGALRTSASGPKLLLVALFTSGPFSLFSLLLLLSTEGAAEPLGLESGPLLGGALQRETAQMTPVKLLRVKPPLDHLRQGFPDRSRARRPALMAP